MIKSYNYKYFKIEILYEDSYIAILNKPSGLLTHKKNGLDNSPNLQESLKDQFTIKDKRKILNNFEIIKTGVVIKPPKPIKIILLLDKNTGDTFNNKHRIKKNLFFDFKIILFILLL